jgi:simple sugar transport system permease protein
MTGLGIDILALGARLRDEIPGFGKWAPPGPGDIPIFGQAVFQQVWLVCLAVLRRCRSGSGWRAGLGIALRSSEDAPVPVANSGLSATAPGYGAVLFTGRAFLSIGDIHTFAEGMIHGAGCLAIAAVIFGNRTPGRRSWRASCSGWRSRCDSSCGWTPPPRCWR